MNFKKREHENRSNSKFLEHGKNPNIKYKKCKFLINEVGVWGWFIKRFKNKKKIQSPLKNFSNSQKF